jgi:hypothetical protein
VSARLRPAAFLLLALASGPAAAQEASLPAPPPPEPFPTAGVFAGLDLSALVGLSLAEAFRRFGAPERVFAARGQESWQDDVVFYYPGYLYLFWYQDRVWQARVDEHYAGSFLAANGPVSGGPAANALAMGRSREEVLGLLGPPLRELGDSLVYHLEDRGYPVRLRLYFRDGLLADAYCYRGDL